MVGDRVASVGERLPLCVGRFLDGLRPWEAAGQREAVTALQAFERGLGSAGRHCPCVRGVEKYPGPSFRLSKQPGPDGRKRRAATARADTLRFEFARNYSRHGEGKASASDGSSGL
jgi:hypothetical protein